MKKSILLAPILVLATVFIIASVVHADSFTFTTSPGATESGGNPVSAQALFTTGSNTVTVQLTNLLVNPLTVAQNLSDISFTLSAGTSATLSSSSGVERTVAANGTFSVGPTVATGWVLTGTPTTGLKLDGLGAGSDVPAHTIIGLPDGSNVYSNANNSIAGNVPHNPFLFDPVTFNLAVSGVTADTDVFDVVFSFGTASGNDVPGGSPVPEPATMFLLGSGLIGIGVYAKKKFKK